MNGGDKPKPIGRPRLEEPPLTADTRARLLEIARTGAPDMMMARAVGIDPSTFYKWRTREEPGFVRFFQEIDRERASGHLEVLEATRKAALEMQFPAQKYILSCAYPELSERRAALKAAAEEEAERAAKAAAQVNTAEAFGDLSDAEWAHLAKVAIELKRAAAAKGKSPTEEVNAAFAAAVDDDG